MTAKKQTTRQTVKPTRPRRGPSVDDLLSLVETTTAHAPAAPVPTVAKIAALDSQGRPLLSLSGHGIPARSTLRVTPDDVGREALVLFENNDPTLPIITGLLTSPAAAGAPNKLVFEAGQEMVLQVGKASITLTKDGRIVIRGADVLTRSSGSNRIKGGSVSIN